MKGDEDGAGGGEGGSGRLPGFLGSKFTLEPLTAPGLRLAAILDKPKPTQVVLTADEKHAHALTLRVQPSPAAAPVSSVSLVVVDSGGPLDGHFLCRDTGTAKDFPGPGGCEDAHAECGRWAGGGECIHNAGGAGPLSEGLLLVYLYTFASSSSSSSTCLIHLSMRVSLSRVTDSPTSVWTSHLTRYHALRESV